MRKFALTLFFFVSSCYSFDGKYCSTPSEYDRNLAQTYYDGFGVFRAHLSDEKALRLFGCNFHKTTDYIYSYNTFWGKKFILVRYGHVVTWAEDK